MSIPKEKLIIQEIKRIIDEKNDDETEHYARLVSASEAFHQIKHLVDSYVDPGYIGGPVVGEEVEPQVSGIVHHGRIYLTDEGVRYLTEKGLLGEEVKEVEG